jgi:hypothetical protein
VPRIDQGSQRRDRKKDRNIGTHLRRLGWRRW